MNGGPDGDRAFEEALRRSLSSRAGGAPSSPCLDAETIAAYADGDLGASVRAEAQQHLAECGRCQATLAALIRTTPASAAAVPWWSTILRARWLVPIAAAATALVVWVAVPRPSINHAPARVVVTQSPDTVARSSSPAETEAKKDSRRDQPAAAVEQAPASAATAAPPLPPANASAEPERRAREELRDAPAPSAPAEASAQSAAGAGAQPAPPSAAPAPAPAAAPPSAATAAPSAARATRAFSPQVDSLAKTADANAAAGGVVEVLSPNPLLRWRINGRSVQHSTDGGATWQDQMTGATADLLAGSSPSPAVCWLVGRSNTVLLTIDGGQRWQTLNFPEIIDLRGVTATDALNAVVSTTRGTTYRTTDGGRTWR